VAGLPPLVVDGPNGLGYVQHVNALPSSDDAAPSQDMADRAHLDVMRLLSAQPELSQREVASSLGISLGKVNYCLRALIEKGFVKAENYRNSRNKLGYFYLLTPSGIAAKAELTKHFLARKVREYEELRLEIERLQRETNAASSSP
jgi:EPS-associated MarR family transcriptional regulator